MFNVFKDDVSNKMVFEEVVVESKKKKNNNSKAKRRSLYGEVLLQDEEKETLTPKKDNFDIVTGISSLINFNNPIFKILNLKIEPEAVNNFDSKAFDDLVVSREKQEEEIKYE